MSWPVTITNPDSTTATFSYSGNVVTQYDALGVPRDYTSNALGQLTRVVEHPTSSTTITTDYQYYVFGPLQQVTQNGTYGLSRTFTSDWLGRVTQESHPESGTTSYAVDAGGLVTSRTDARGKVTTYSYDDIARLTAVDYDDATPDVTYTYDDATGYEGLLHSVSVSGVTSTSFTYDNAGQVTGESVTLNGLSASFNTAYTYDLGGRLLTTTYPSGRVVTQAYAVSGGTAGDRISGLTDSSTSATLLQSTAVNAAGALTARTLGSSITESRSYNTRNQLTRIQTPASGTALLDLNYSYGTTNNGRIQSRADNVQPEHSTSYTYDPIGRLTAAGNSTWNIAWTLDAYGNRLTQTPTGLASALGSPTVSYSNNKMNGSPYTYDDVGNLTYDGTNHYYYDAEDRIYQIGSSAIAYAYDQAGRRIKKTSGGTTTYYLYGQTGLMSEFTTSGAPSNATAAASTDRLQYRVGEQTGTGVLLLAADGIPRENNRVFPFGESWNASGGSSNNEKFTTYQHDGESELDYAMARYYASRSGRFLTPDPGHVGASLGDPQSWNAYVYTGNDSVNFVDPTGRYICNGSEKQCSDFKKTFGRIEASNRDDVKRAVSAYGKPGVDNGVVVQFVKTPVHPGEVVPNPQSLRFDSKTEKFTALLTVKIKESSISDDVMVAHEGSHLADYQAFIASISIANQWGNPMLNITGEQSEIRAYELSIGYAREGNRTLQLGSCGILPICVFPGNMTPTSQAQRILDLLHDPSNLYDPMQLNSVLYPDLSLPR